MLDLQLLLKDYNIVNLGEKWLGAMGKEEWERMGESLNLKKKSQKTKKH